MSACAFPSPVSTVLVHVCVCNCLRLTVCVRALSAFAVSLLYSFCVRTLSAFAVSLLSLIVLCSGFVSACCQSVVEFVLFSGFVSYCCQSVVSVVCSGFLSVLVSFCGRTLSVSCLALVAYYCFLIIFFPSHNLSSRIYSLYSLSIGSHIYCIAGNF